ncbi:MAG: bifunctional phosphopantothenoylcysteine decarboxylase/phosphopantothenate--cysteine ligase CoaBC [Chitinivibrionales bacterium]|nr:bifunctional phosphopantothenoylcysteine decarboxylase/phosphopantothenate--cysteine ligase CoaBC [Chitinivibrionales bacterium]
MSCGLKLVLGITGGIAAYKAPGLVRLLLKHGATVRTVLTPHARSFVGEEALRTLTHHIVYQDTQSTSTLYPNSLDHISLAEWADCLLVAPATANTIAKLAHGIGDNLLTTLALSLREASLILAPAMNTEMWRHPATQANLNVLRDRGTTILPVTDGELACGTTGPGRMLDIEDIAAHIRQLPEGRTLIGKRVLISSGPTVEQIDPVRVITNKSSGKMGAALAEQALLMGAQVTLVAGPALAQLPAQARIVRVSAAREMKSALEQEFGCCDICIMAAAVSDYRPEKQSTQKLSRRTGPEINLKLVANPDIAEALGAAKRNQYLVCFSLQTNGDEQQAREKMQRKQCDMMVLNRVGDSLEKDTTQVSIFYADHRVDRLETMSKLQAAGEILGRIAHVCSDQAHE